MRVNAWLPCLTGLVTLILTILILIAGLNGHVLSNFFFLKAETASLNVPSNLSNSSFLQDLSKLTHTDLVGQDASASSLGLADTYTVSVLTLCAKNKTDTECSSPHFGVNFNPDSDLKLSDTALQGSLPGALSTNSNIAGFLGIAYVVVIALTFLAPTVNLFTHSPGPALGSAIMSVLSTIFLLAASIASLVIFSNFNKAFNSALSPFGAHSSLGSPLFAISWVATAFSVATTILSFRSYRAASRSRGKRTGPPDQKSEPESEPGAPRQLRLLERIPTWKIHKYRQLGKQGVQVQKVGAVKQGATDEDFDSLVNNVGMEDMEDDDDGDPTHIERPLRGIRMQVLRNDQSNNTDVMYEPFRGA